MAKTCTIKMSDLSILRNCMLKARQVEMKSYYLRYPKFRLMIEFKDAIEEYRNFISKYAIFYTESEKEYLSKILDIARNGQMNMLMFQKVSFTFFHHVSDHYRRFRHYLDV